MANAREPTTAEASRIEEDAVHSAKGHFEAARTWSGLNLVIGIPTIIAGATAGATALKEYVVAASLLSALAAVGAALLTFLKPSDRASLHTQAGNAYKALHNQARIFREIDCTGPTADEELVAQVKKLAQERDSLNGTSPLISRRAFERARRGIDAGETSYEADRRRIRGV